MKKLAWLTVPILALLLAGAPLRAGEVKLTNDVAWVMAADTYKECVQQAYLNAMERLKGLADGRQPGTWCVVLDADETVISNVEYQARLQAQRREYSNASWKAWCEEEAAVALPGAVDFCSLAQKLGGKVIIVTNRKGEVKEAIDANLKKVELPFDLLLVREGPYALDRSKQMRRNDIEKGSIKTLPPGQKFPPLDILMLCGDQNHDLYDAEKLSFEQVKDRFGRNLVVLPNPMYGDWAFQGVYVETGSASPGVAEGALTWEEAMKLPIGTQVTVQAKIVSVYDPATRGKGGPVKLNVDRNWRESLTFVFYAKDRQGNSNGFPAPNSFLNKTVLVNGELGEHNEARQMMLRSPSQIQFAD